MVEKASLEERKNMPFADPLKDIIEYGQGHILKHNGVGDWDAICPTHGKLHFVPWLSGELMKGYQCRACGHVFEKPIVRPK
jgi:hypothetical protein